MLKKLVQSDSTSTDLKFELGDTLLQQDEAEAALVVLRDAVRINPHLLPAQAALAKACMELGRASEAVPHFEAALPIDADGSLHFQLAKAYEQTGQIALAKRAREQFAAIARRRGSNGKEDETEIAAP